MFTIGITLIGVLVTLYIITRYMRRNFYPHRVLGYGTDGSVPRVIKKFELIKEEEFI